MANRKTKKSRQPRAAPTRREPSSVAGSWWLSNLLIVALFCAAWYLQAAAPIWYKSLLQEDGPVEWATVVAFLGGAAVALLAAWRQWRARALIPWFLVGVAGFCIVVAGEEASWGQRLLGYQPPTYFLENNFQQELNVHNVVPTGTRKLAVKTLILGYGVVLPLLGAWAPLRQRLQAWAVEPSPVHLAPSFLLVFWLYQTYPWDLTGELVELLLGLGFLLGLFDVLQRFDGLRRFGPPLASSARFRAVLVGSWAAVLVMGLATARVTELLLGESSVKIEAAELEVEALKEDFLALSGRSDKLATKCGQHRRVYTWLERSRGAGRGLLEKKFAGLTEQGLDEDRARFFLDPWNNPYWIRHKCNRKDRIARVFVYSFGPNRKRDSTEWEVRPDDVGALIGGTGDLPSDS